MSDTPRPQPGENGYQADQLIDHDYDGIQEYDNRLPNWWLWILYGSIIFALAYWLFFHTIGAGKLPRERYAAEMQKAAETQLARASKGGLSDQSLELMAAMPDRVSEGKAIFTQYCVVCHRDQGQGLVGPNLTDAYWIHGGRPMDIHKTITDGVLAKGMAAWGRQLGPNRVEAVTAYVLTLRNTNVPGKAHEGELYQPAAPAATGG
jgi:cytochrome c oxidase cbb3-type subunit 3